MKPEEKKDKEIIERTEEKIDETDRMITDEEAEEVNGGRDFFLPQFSSSIAGQTSARLPFGSL